jgi:hypothetical protein
MCILAEMFMEICCPDTVAAGRVERRRCGVTCGGSSVTAPSKGYTRLQETIIAARLDGESRGDDTWHWLLGIGLTWEISNTKFYMGLSE